MALRIALIYWDIILWLPLRRLRICLLLLIKLLRG
jgi:hypothetical protein